MSGPLSDPHPAWLKELTQEVMSTIPEELLCKLGAMKQENDNLLVRLDAASVEIARLHVEITRLDEEALDRAVERNLSP